MGFKRGGVDTMKYVDVGPVESTPKHSHYYRDVSDLSAIDVYRLIRLFNVTDPCAQHILKKCLVQGGRGGAKDR